MNPKQKRRLTIVLAVLALVSVFVYFFGHWMLQRLLQIICDHGAGCF
jgi:hypothetical protein